MEYKIIIVATNFSQLKGYSKNIQNNDKFV